MKLRTSFVTNSSSSSYIIARKNELSEEQKKAIIEYVENAMLGNSKGISTKEELDEFFKEEYYEDVNDEDFEDSYNYEKYKKALDAIERGLTVYTGWVSFECDSSEADLLVPLWEKLSKLNDDFVEIDTDLDY